VRASRAADLWWRVASIYCVDVEKYADSDGDGIGDFRGLTERVDTSTGSGSRASG
jgi:glycosidase